jgi:hypothetical protein
VIARSHYPRITPEWPGPGRRRKSAIEIKINPIHGGIGCRHSFHKIAAAGSQFIAINEGGKAIEEQLVNDRWIGGVNGLIAGGQKQGQEDKRFFHASSACSVSIT